MQVARVKTLESLHNIKSCHLINCLATTYDEIGNKPDSRLKVLRGEDLLRSAWYCAATLL